MLRKALRSSTLVKASNMRLYQFDPKSRLRMGDPRPQEPPKHIFEYTYRFNNYPDMYMGFTYRPRNKYVAHHYLWYETFMFSYRGEWWHIGSLFWNWVVLLFPFVLLMIRYKENVDAGARKNTQTTNYMYQGGFQQFDSMFLDESELLE